jgi:hypothetical protein
MIRCGTLRILGTRTLNMLTIHLQVIDFASHEVIAHHKCGTARNINEPDMNAQDPTLRNVTEPGFRLVRDFCG